MLVLTILPFADASPDIELAANLARTLESLPKLDKLGLRSEYLPASVLSALPPTLTHLGICRHGFGVGGTVGLSSLGWANLLDFLRNLAHLPSLTFLEISPDYEADIQECRSNHDSSLVGMHLMIMEALQITCEKRSTTARKFQLVCAAEKALLAAMQEYQSYREEEFERRGEDSDEDAPASLMD